MKHVKLTFFSIVLDDSKWFYYFLKDWKLTFFNLKLFYKAFILLFYTIFDDLNA